MKTTTLFLAMVILSMQACEEEGKNPSDPLITLQSSRTEIGVGLGTPVLITAQVTKDASGDTCNFSATNGSFDTEQSTSNESSSTVDVEGRAEVFFFSPSEPGDIFITASIKSINSRIKIKINPVAAFEIDLPESLQIEEQSVFQINVDPLYAGQPMQVSAPLANLEVLGTAKDDIGNGTKVFPIIDSNGKVNLMITAPATPATVTITASLFGTTASDAVAITE